MIAIYKVILNLLAYSCQPSVFGNTLALISEYKSKMLLECTLPYLMLWDAFGINPWCFVDYPVGSSTVVCAKRLRAIKIEHTWTR